MGIIQRQSIKATIINYLGVGVGYINLSVLFPLIFSTEQIGLLTFLMSVVTLSSQLGMLGISKIIVRFRQHIIVHYSKNILLRWTIILPITGLFFMCIILYFFKDDVLRISPSKDNFLLQNYYPYIYPLLFFYSLFMLTIAYSSSLQRIVVPSFLENVLYKIFVFVFCILFYFNTIDFTFFVNLYIYPYLFFGILLIIYNKSIEKNQKINNSNKKKSFGEILQFGFLSSLTGLGDRLMGNLDNIMISLMLGLSDTGVYKLAFTIAVVVELPMRSVGKIAAPIIANSWENGKIDEIKTLLKKSSANLLAIGGLIFLLINTNTNSIFQLIPNGDAFIEGTSVIIIITFAKLFSLSSGVNGQIIANTKYYYFNFISMFFLAILGIATNLYFIDLMGIKGAALATLISIVLFNVWMTVFLYFKMNMHQFTLKWFINYAIIGIIFYVSTFIPAISNPFLDIIIKSLFVVFIYFPGIYVFKCSIEINELIKKYIRIIR